MYDRYYGSRRLSEKRGGLLDKAVSKAKKLGYNALGGDAALEREIMKYKNNPGKYAHSPLKGLVDKLLYQRGFTDENGEWYMDMPAYDEDDYYDDEDYDSDTDPDVGPDFEFVDDYDQYEDDDDSDEYFEKVQRRRPSCSKARPRHGVSMREGIERTLRHRH